MTNLPATNPTTSPVFSFEGHQVRVVMRGERNDQPWFVAKDVLEALDTDVGSQGTTNWLQTLREDEREKVHKGSIGVSYGTSGGYPYLNLISESGLYKVILRANTSNPAAKKFQDWVTREVLPSIRRDGAYIMGEEKVRSGEMSEDEFILKAMTILKSKAERLTEERDNLKGIVDAHLVNLTIDEWRALNGQYLTRSTILTLAHRMKKRLAQLGVEVPTREVACGDFWRKSLRWIHIQESEGAVPIAPFVWGVGAGELFTLGSKKGLGLSQCGMMEFPLRLSLREPGNPCPVGYHSGLPIRCFTS